MDIVILTSIGVQDGKAIKRLTRVDVTLWKQK